MLDLRIEARFRNNVLSHAIYDVYPSVADFCRTTKLSPSLVGELVNLKRAPKTADGAWSALARRLSDATGIGVEELFPDRLYDTPELRLRRVAEVDSVRFVALSEARRVALLPDAEGAIERERLQDAMARVLDTLTPRERLVIRQRFGFDGDEPETLEQVGERLGVSRARAREIEQKALRKLRHPSRVRIFDPDRWRDEYPKRYEAARQAARDARETDQRAVISQAIVVDDFDTLRARAERLSQARADAAIAVSARISSETLATMRMTRRDLHRDIYEALTWQDAYRRDYVDRLFGEGGDAFVAHMDALAKAGFVRR
jgi:RNA polymerase sigma factor (sigma-70 family)